MDRLTTTAGGWPRRCRSTPPSGPGSEPTSLSAAPRNFAATPSPRSSPHRNWPQPANFQRARGGTAGARDNVDIIYEPDAFTDSFEANNLPPPAPLIPKGLGVASIHLAQIRDRPHGAADLLVTATVLFADGYGREIGIIHYDGNVAKVTWAFLARGGGATVIGAPGHQEVAVTSLWTTAADPQCCPARSYRFVLARASEPQAGEYYQVIANNRPWLGAIITEQPPQSPNSQAVVGSVGPRSPAARLRQPGPH